MCDGEVPTLGGASQRPYNRLRHPSCWPSYLTHREASRCSVGHVAFEAYSGSPVSVDGAPNTRKSLTLGL